MLSLAGRLHVIGGESLSPFSHKELVRLAQEKIRGSMPGTCTIIDRTEALPTRADDMMAVIQFLAQVVHDSEGGGGRTLVFVQRTSENADGFNAAFAAVKHGEALANSSDPISFAAPGWLAWCRDDYFFASPSYDLRLSSQVLHGFAVGESNCCICLESMFEKRPCIGLECGHLIHAECLQRAAHAEATRGVMHSCPLCRRPFSVKEDGTVTAAPEEVPGLADSQPRPLGEVVLDIRPPREEARAVLPDAQQHARCIGCCAIM